MSFLPASLTSADPRLIGYPVWRYAIPLVNGWLIAPAKATHKSEPNGLNPEEFIR